MGRQTSSTKEAGSSSRMILRGLGRWVDLTQRHARKTLVLTLLVTFGLGGLATSTLGFNVDPNALFSADLRFQKMIREFERYFPVLTDSLLIVVDGDPTVDVEAFRGTELVFKDGIAFDSAALFASVRGWVGVR